MHPTNPQPLPPKLSHITTILYIQSFQPAPYSQAHFHHIFYAKTQSQILPNIKVFIILGSNQLPAIFLLCYVLKDASVLKI